MSYIVIRKSAGTREIERLHKVSSVFAFREWAWCAHGVLIRDGEAAGLAELGLGGAAGVEYSELDLMVGLERIS